LLELAHDDACGVSVDRPERISLEGQRRERDAKAAAACRTVDERDVEFAANRDLQLHGAGIRRR